MYIYVYIIVMASAGALSCYYAARARAKRRRERLPSARELAEQLAVASAFVAFVAGTAAQLVVLSECFELLDKVKAEQRDLSPDEVARMETLQKWLF